MSGASAFALIVGGELITLFVLFLLWLADIGTLVEQTERDKERGVQ